MQNKLDDFDFEAFSRERKEASPEQKEKAAQKKKRNTQMNIAFYAVLGVICTALIITIVLTLYVNLSPSRNPDRAVKAYVKNVQSEKWEKVYNDIDLSTSFFEDKKAFAAYCRENPGTLKLTDEKIADFELELDSENENVRVYSVHYVTDEGNEGIFNIAIEKIVDGAGKFDKYKINSTPNASPNYTIFAPVGASIAVDGKQIKPAQEIKKENGSVGKYVISYIPDGEHTLIAKADGCDDIALKINVSKDNNENELMLEFSVTKESYDKLCADADGYIDTIFKGIIDDSLTADSLPFSTEFKNTKWDGFLNRLKGEMYKSSESYKITGFEKTASALQTEYTEPTLGTAQKAFLTVSYKFNYSYTVSSGTQDKPQETKNSEGYINIIYTFDGGQWKIDDIFEQVWF